MTPEQQTRYSRQIKLPQVGEAGQERLLQSHVLIIGMGGLGSPVSMYEKVDTAGMQAALGILRSKTTLKELKLLLPQVGGWCV